MKKILKGSLLISLAMVLSTTALFSQFQQGAYGSADPSFPTVDPPKVWTTERALGVNKDPGAYKGLQPYYLYQWDYPALLVHSHVSTDRKSVV